MGKIKRKINPMGIVKNGGTFFLGLVIFMCITDLLPQKPVEITREQLTEIEVEEGRVREEYNNLSKNIEDKKTALLDKKNKLDEENKGLENEINELNKEIESLKGN